MKKVLTHYRVTVLSLKSHRGLSAYAVPDDGVFIAEGDVFSGYGHPEHIPDKYFDLWFAPILDQYERSNYVTFGRIKRMEAFRNGKGKFYVTKLGRFIVEELGNEKKSDDQV